MIFQLNYQSLRTVLFLCLCSFTSITSLDAQRVFYEGRVVDRCSGEPLEGVEIRFLGNSTGQTPGAFHETTDANGNYSALLSGYDNWTITVSEPTGPTVPGIYFRLTSQGNQSNLDFELLPGDWEVEINGDPISPLNTSSSPLVICKGQENCIDINDEFKEKYGSTGNIAYCFRGRAYRTDLAGQKLELLAESPCITVGGRTPVGIPPCGTGVDLSQVLGQINEIPGEGLLVLIEVEQFCCNRACQPGPESLTNTQEFFVRIQEELEFDFVFNAPLNGPGFSIIDNQNSSVPGNDDLADSKVPRFEELPGVSAGQSSVGIEITNDTEVEKIDEYRLIIEEVSCNDGNTITLLYDEIFDGDFVETGLRFNSLLIGPPGQETIGYFDDNTDAGNTVGKCYKVTLIADSECGPLEQFSYFNIYQDCSSCLQTGNGTSGGDNPVALNAEVFPLPATSALNVQVSQIEEGQIELKMLSSTGQILQNVKDAQAVEGLNRYEIDVSTYPPGLYLLSISNGQQRITRKVIVE